MWVSFLLNQILDRVLKILTIENSLDLVFFLRV
jgi:hypothetical protein